MDIIRHTYLIEQLSLGDKKNDMLLPKDRKLMAME